MYANTARVFTRGAKSDRTDREPVVEVQNPTKPTADQLESYITDREPAVEMKRPTEPSFGPVPVVVMGKSRVQCRLCKILGIQSKCRNTYLGQHRIYTSNNTTPATSHLPQDVGDDMVSYHGNATIAAPIIGG